VRLAYGRHAGLLSQPEILSRCCFVDDTLWLHGSSELVSIGVLYVFQYQLPSFYSPLIIQRCLHCVLGFSFDDLCAYVADLGERLHLHPTYIQRFRPKQDLAKVAPTRQLRDAISARA